MQTKKMDDAEHEKVQLTLLTRRNGGLYTTLFATTIAFTIVCMPSERPQEEGKGGAHRIYLDVLA